MRYTPRVLSFVLGFILFIIASPCVFSQQPVQAVIRELAGTVEIKQVNSEAWEAASQGQLLAWDTAISTGFRSTAVIVLGDSLVTLRPLTRISIMELSQNQGNEKVELNLQSGRVRADVKAPERGQTEFVIRSPHATNSVRGTVFEFDTLELTVLEGTVEFSGISGGVSGTSFLVDAGGYSRLDEYTGRVSSPAAGAASALWLDPPIASEPIRVLPAPPAPSFSQSEPKPPPTDPPRPPPDPTQPGQRDPDPVGFNPEIVF